MPGIFARLFAYRPREGRDPAEDFFTEVLAGVLNANDGLRKEFAEWLIHPKMRPVPLTLTFAAPIETQKVIGSEGRCDMWLDARDEKNARHLVVLENKIGAREGDKQLQRYANDLAARSEAASRTLVYVTPHSRASEPPTGTASGICFRECRWYEVYDWLTKWVQRQERVSAGSSTVLAKELLALMEDWSLDMNLSAADLTVATTYQVKARKRLYQLLNEVHEACKTELLKSTKGRWSYDYGELIYSSPSIEGKGVHIEFGFDFGRKDEDWDVLRLGLPSAYFAIRGEGVEQQDWDALAEGWKSPPINWGWPEVDRVTQLGAFETGGSSLRNVYLGFFLDAMAEAKQAVGV